MADPFEIHRAQAVKRKYERALLRKKNVVGVGVGYRTREGEYTEEVVLTVMVRHKQPPADLRPADRIPEQLDGVPVDVQEVGVFKAL